jgi:hypothetical protein
VNLTRIRIAVRDQRHRRIVAHALVVARKPRPNDRRVVRDFANLDASGLVRTFGGCGWKKRRDSKTTCD